MLSVIIPCYNEAKTIRKSLERTQAFLKDHGIPHEIIVVDDGSRDATAREARKAAGVKVMGYKRNKGKGYAVRQGMMAAEGEHALFMDADLATALEAIPRALAEAKDHDVVIGSRKAKGARLARRQPALRRVVGTGFQAFLRLLGMGRVKDTQCGFKLFSRQAARTIFSEALVDRFAFDVEALYLARKHGYRIKELPVTWHDDPDSRVKPFVDGTRMVMDALFIRAAHSRHAWSRRLARPLGWAASHTDRFLTYVFFSGIATATDFSVLIGLTELAGVNYLLSAAAGYVTGMVVHYLLNKRNTFKNRSHQYAAQFGVHASVATIGLALQQALLFALVQGTGMWYVQAKVLTTIVVLAWNYAGHSKLTYGLFK